MINQSPEALGGRRPDRRSTVVPARPSSRYAELTYSSFDDGVTGGGWQIKQTRGDLTDAERRALRSQVTTHLDTGVDLPRFPTPEEIERFPRRLAYSPAGPAFEPGATAWWHTAEAGADASGRPGNVFCHVVLDRTPQRPPSFRPIDLWRSPSWLTPYGPEQVAAAELSPQLPDLGRAPGVDDVIDFCFADFDRISVLAPLLDACAAALAGGPRVILAVREVERASLWITAVSRLTAAQPARRLYFSTLERQSGLAEAIRHGLQLICVPAADLDAVDHERARLRVPTVLLVEDEFPELGDLGTADEAAHPHLTRHGDRIAVTPWSVLARVVLEAESADQARVALQRIDPIADQVADLADAADYSPDWPLAMSIAESGDVFAEAQPEAALVIGRHSPAGLERLPELYRPAAQLISTRCGENTTQAWDELRGATAGTAAGPDGHGSTVGAVLIFDSYLRRLLVDHDWLARPGGVPLPDPLPGLDRGRLMSVVRERLGSLLGNATEASDTSTRSELIEPVALARLADVLIRTGLVDDAVIADLRRLAGPLVARLAADDAPELVRRIGPLADATLRRVIRPVVVLGPPLPQSLGSRFSSAVLDWLYPQPPQPVALRTLYDQQRSGSLPADYWLRAERDWAAYARGGRTALDGETAYAAWTMLDATERTARSPERQQLLTGPSGPDWSACLPLLSTPVDPDDLYCLIHRYDPEPGIANLATAATLLTVPWAGDARSAALQRLCRRLQQSDRRDLGPTQAADQLPRIREWLADRSWATAWWASRTATIMNAMNTWSRRRELPTTDDYAADVRTGMAAVLIIELIHGRSASDVSGLLQNFGPDRVTVDQPLTETVAAVINSSEKVRRDHRDQAPPTVIGPSKLLAAVLRAERRSLDGRLYTEAGAWLAGFRTRQGDPLLESLLISWLRRTGDQQQRRVRDEAVAILQQSLSTADNAKDLERAVAGRLKSLRRRAGS